MNDEENLPIDFKLRDQDNGNTPGGGDDVRQPKWVLSGKKLNDRKDQLLSDIDKIKMVWDKNSFSELPHALKVTFIDKAKANTHQKKIISIFEVGKNTGQIGFINKESLIMKVSSKENLKEIKKNLSDIKKNVSPISAITKIELFKPELKIVNFSEAYKLIPLDYSDSSLNEKVIKIIKNCLNEHNIENKLISYGSNNKAVRITTVTEDSLKFIRTLPVRSIEPISKANTSFENINESMDDIPDLLSFDSKGEYPIIGLLDTGVDQNKLTKNWVIRGNGCNYEPDELDTKHGTYIATLLIHGDTFNKYYGNKNKDSSINGCKIVEVPIVPKGGAEEQVLIANIRNAIEKNPTVHIWNLSVSLKYEISNNEFSQFAMELDSIQKKYNVIICKSAGNDAQFFSKKQVGRLNVGAESIRALTVGSMNRNTDKFKYTIKDLPAKYSRRGPGPASIVKPDLTHFGGDYFAKKSGPSQRADFEQVSDTSSINGEKLIHRVGTSFSTPKVAKNIAELDLLTNHIYDLLTLKALEVHSAEYFGNPSLKLQNRLEYLGYGKPTNAKDTIFDPSYASTLILRGKLEKGQRIDIMEFPYPENLIEKGYYTGQIKITLAYDPILLPNMGTEYCQSNLDIKFGTYDKKETPTAFMQRYNPIQRSGTFNLLLYNNYSKRSMKNNSKYANERFLLKYGQKFHPIKKFAFDLSDLQHGKKANLSSDKHWFLFLEGHYRDYAEKHLNKSDLNIPYSLIITIEDPKRKTQVYNSTINALDKNSFNYDIIKINNNIKLYN